LPQGLTPNPICVPGVPFTFESNKKNTQLELGNPSAELLLLIQCNLQVFNNLLVRP